MSLLGGNTAPDGSGNCFAQLFSAVASNDLWSGLIWSFNNTGTAKIVLANSFKVPKNYVGTAKIIYTWMTTATSGNMNWFADYAAVAAGESLDPSSFTESVNTGAVAVPGTSLLAKETALALTSSNLAVDDVVLLHVSRDPDDAGDTAAATIHLIDLEFEYTDA
jgi:hypothetical protein